MSLADSLPTSAVTRKKNGGTYVCSISFLGQPLDASAESADAAMRRWIRDATTRLHAAYPPSTSDVPPPKTDANVASDQSPAPPFPPPSTSTPLDSTPIPRPASRPMSPISPIFRPDPDALTQEQSDELQTTPADYQTPPVLQVDDGRVDAQEEDESSLWSVESLAALERLAMFLEQEELSMPSLPLDEREAMEYMRELEEWLAMTPDGPRKLYECLHALKNQVRG